MRVIRSPGSMQKLALELRQKRRVIGFVPTMGYLHEGHISLVHRARKAVGKNGVVVISIFVNPTQFAPNEDLTKYPRDFGRDSGMCEEAGVDFIFAPGDEQIYESGKTGKFSTFVVENELSQKMEGVSRPEHFRGVTTIVAKLFNIVLPDVAIFGAKDFQQAAVVQRMVRDLNFPVEIIVAPTMREKDGLAMSSRNKYLSPEERQQAPILWRMLQHAVVRVRLKPVDRDILLSELRELLQSSPAARLDYVEFFDPQTLEPVSKVSKGIHMALAVFLGKTRLIDNIRL
jgi:pantoate--beta-alanine ligase